MAIRIGLLGLAHGHVGMYAAAWAKLPAGRVTLVAAYDHDLARLDAAATQFGVEKAPAADALCNRPDIDALLIGSETACHADHVELAARAGKAIVLQKPIALDLPQADRIVAAVNAAGVPFTLAWQMRTDPQNLQIKQLVDSGALGRIFMIRRRHGLAAHTWGWFEGSWHVKPELNRGVFADDAAHAIDFLLWLKGEPQSVMAEIQTLHNPKVPDDNGVAIFRYADGTLAEIACSFTCIAGENTTEIVGAKGVLIQNFGDAPSANAPRPPGAIGLKWLLEGQKEWTISDIPTPPNHGQRISDLAEPLLAFLEGTQPAICSAEDGRTSLAMTLACYRSAELGRRVGIGEMSATD